MNDTAKALFAASPDMPQLVRQLFENVIAASVRILFLGTEP